MDAIACSRRCWFAKREECTCSCNGSNHKVGNKIFDLEKEEDRKSGAKYLESLENAFKEYKKLRKRERRLLRKGTEVIETVPSSLLPKRTKKISKLLKLS